MYRSSAFIFTCTEEVTRQSRGWEYGLVWLQPKTILRSLTYGAQIINHRLLGGFSLVFSLFSTILKLSRRRNLHVAAAGLSYGGGCSKGAQKWRPQNCLNLSHIHLAPRHMLRALLEDCPRTKGFLKLGSDAGGIEYARASPALTPSTDGGGGGGEAVGGTGGALISIPSFSKTYYISFPFFSTLYLLHFTSVIFFMFP
jgi:hypothetical protein